MMKKSIFAIIMTGIMIVSGTSVAMAAGTPLFTGSKIQAEKAGAQAGTGSETSTKVQEKTSEAKKIEAENTTGDEDETSFSAQLIDDMEIVTPYYSLVTPVRWMGAYTLETISNQTGMWLEFRYKDNSEEPYNGHIFSILMTDKEDYKIIADHDLLGELQDEEGNVYHVVAVYPTDVQYSKANKDNYMAMFNEAEAVLETLKAAEGCTYTKVEKDSGEI